RRSKTGRHRPKEETGGSEQRGSGASLRRRRAHPAAADSRPLDVDGGRRLIAGSRRADRRTSWNGDRSRVGPRQRSAALGQFLSKRVRDESGERGQAEPDPPTGDEADNLTASP